MPVRKLSVALDSKVAKAAVTSAARRGLSVSAWLNQAAENALRIEAGLAAVAEWEAKHGRLTDAELAAADRVFERSSRGRTERRAS